MTTSTAPTARTTTSLAPIAIGVTAATLVLDAFGIWGSCTSEDGAAVEMLVTGAFTLVSRVVDVSRRRRSSSASSP